MNSVTQANVHRFLHRLCRQAAAVLLAAWPGTAIDQGFPAFHIPETTLTLRAEATARRFVAAHGRRGMVVGYASESLEGWIYPFCIFHDFHVGFRAEDSADVVPGAALVREIVVNPESVTRVYSAQNFTVRETVFVPLDLPGFVILYDVESRAPVQIVLSFRPDLNLMWPGGIGGQSYDWDAKRHAFVLQESSEKYSALIGSPVANRHTAPGAYAEPWDVDRRLTLELDIPAASKLRHSYPLVVSCTLPKHYDGAKTYEQLLDEVPRLYAEAAEHYRKLVADSAQLETPEREVNLAYAWARITLDQAYVCNPFLGCGLVAGYGPSRDTRRPQYAWFFGGDAMINTWALAATGDHDRAREAMRFIREYQNKDTGEIFHELSQSAGLINWFNDYPYAYRHTDASAMYLVAFRNFYRAAGDLGFLRASWDSLRRAFNYLLSRLDPADGFVTVPTRGWGGDETIAEQVGKDIYLESLWVAGAESFAELARVMGDHQAAEHARAHAAKAQASIDAKLWNPQRDFFFYGFDARGNLLTQELGQPNWGIWLDAFDADKSERALDRMARANWLTDWGLRSVPCDDPLYGADTYGHGSVWPLGTGVQALALYRHHRPLQGYPLWRGLVEQTFLNSLGHVTEVFSGDLYRELDVSVPEQTWSSGMVITALMRGLLGLDPDTPASKLVWKPHLPANWPRVKLANLRVGQSMLNLEMEQSDMRVRLKVENAGPQVEVEFAPEIPLGARNLRATLNGKRVAVAFASHAHDAHAELKFFAESNSEVVVSFDPGVRPWLPAQILHIGDVSSGLRILSSKLEGRTYTAEVEGRPGRCSSMVLATPWQVEQVTGGKLSSRQGAQWHFIVSRRADSCPAESAYETWTFQVEFAP